MNPFKASIAGMMFMSEEQRAIRAEIEQHFDSMSKAARIAFDKDRAGLERMGVW